MAVRALCYRLGIKKISHCSVPVMVVGNVTVGGTGKTPLVAFLANHLKEQGLKPGIISRGYGGRSRIWPQAVTFESDPQQVGDEAVLLAQKTQCPVVVGPNRVANLRQLLAGYDCDRVISDDGLQHTAMGRDIEIVVVDGARRFGNGFCLPAGPLREPVQRLHSVDFVVVNGGQDVPDTYRMRCVPGAIYNLASPKRRFMLEDVDRHTVHAVAGIGHPDRFFQQLKSLGVDIIPRAFPDHHAYQRSDFLFLDEAESDAIVIMTEKDAVKCRRFSDERFWCLPIEVEVDDAFLQSLQLSCHRQKPLTHARLKKTI